MPFSDDKKGAFEEPEEDYCLPSYDGLGILDILPLSYIRDFVFCNTQVSNKLFVYSSSQNLKDHRDSEDAKGGDIVRYKDHQNHGLAMPVLRVKMHHIPSDILEQKFITVKLALSNPENNLRLFDEDKDIHDYCVVIRRIHISYSTYRFEFNPDPFDSSKKFQMTMFYHVRFPVCDFEYKDKVFRWVREYSTILKDEHFEYELFELDPAQESLFDGADRASGKINSKNPLKGNPLKNYLRFRSPHERDQYRSKTKIAHFGYSHRRVPGRGRLQATSNLVLVQNEAAGQPPVDVNNNHTIPLDIMVFLTTATVLKKIEFERYQAGAISTAY